MTQKNTFPHKVNRNADIESDSQLIIQTKTAFFIPKKEPEFESEHRFTS